MNLTYLSKLFTVLSTTAALLMIVGCTDETPTGGDPPPDKVSGTVVDAKLYPLPGAVITVGTNTDTSDASGKFSLNTSAVRGFASVSVAKKGYQTNTKDIPSSGEMGNMVLVPNLICDTLEAPFDVPSWYGPSGWMGDHQDIAMNDANATNLLNNDPDGKNTEWIYTPASNANNWAGAQYQHPDNNWGDPNVGSGVAEPGLIVTKATKVTFYARGKDGGEKVTFLAGGRPNANYMYNNSFWIEEVKTLTTEWQQFELDLTSSATNSVLWGFGWSTSKDNVSGTSLTFYVDEIRYE